MRALSVKHFRADIPLFVHIMHHHDEFESHPLWEELSRYQNSTCVICVEDIKMEVRHRRINSPPPMNVHSCVFFKLTVLLIHSDVMHFHSSLRALRRWPACARSSPT
jgi:hypothetical protein